ncbi:hypothetical protein CALK_1160 [Chitinivibrio alkaliphilus ACht1]|uniref:MgtC-like C-terminal domain-containing protein n=2 Tax=Chitinivibrio TaxID=1505231 RepID=U7D8P4_9BACT|nr:hypothetical protein [Chitinivibrio alkaliphilus]ERP31941.1 hypothetical protein CALK_1160 [Chitinivibrio alkaliphilus ACht1]
MARLRSFKSKTDSDNKICFMTVAVETQGELESLVEQIAERISLESGVRDLRWNLTNTEED